MINFFFENGSKQKLTPTAAFFSIPRKGEPTIYQKCLDIMSDLGAYRFEIIK